MLTIDIPGRNPLALQNLVLDYNGTIACDGALLPGVAPAVEELRQVLAVHVLTADTFGSAGAQLAPLGVALALIPPGGQAEAKAAFVEKLGADTVVAIGNGANDAAMLARAALGIAVIEGEGAAGAALRAADVVVTDIRHAFDLLLKPLRLKATLRT
ncbi:hypothetical protein A33M_0939 [Rhodovulum sp. PH10]|nr:hypothetical protein A33M_0939 [Rhodovulum sp. PH10]